VTLSSSITTIHLKVYGKVQGVSYRYWVKENARKLCISGWVKNKDDKTVEIIANGTQAHIDSFIESCNRGSENSDVQKIDIIIIDKVGHGGSFPLSDFQVIYDNLSDI
tara:strand:- start:147 stop:470 length:324 start_codon:yes stop_codon:yes gene_type:complete